MKRKPIRRFGLAIALASLLLCACEADETPSTAQSSEESLSSSSANPSSSNTSNPTSESTQESSESEETAPDMSGYSWHDVDSGDGSYSYPDNSEGTSREPFSTQQSDESDDPFPGHSSDWSDPDSDYSEPSDSFSEEIIDPSNVRYGLTDLPTGTKLSAWYEVRDTAYYSSFATRLAMKEIARLGFDVFPAYAVLPAANEGEEATMLPGLAFTTWSLYESASETNIYSCGFMQIVPETGTIEALLVGKDETLDDDLTVASRIDVSEGVFVYPQDDDGKRFVIESNAFLDGFSGVYQGTFFSYRQRSAFSLSIDVKSASGRIETYANEDLDLYDYDTHEYLYKASLFREKEGIEGYAIYGKRAAEAYQRAVEILEKSIQLQEENGLNIGLSSIVLFSDELFDSASLYTQREAIQGRIASLLEHQPLAENQYLVVTYDDTIGDFAVTVATDMNYLSKEENVSNGIIKTITSLLMIAGGVTAVVMSAGTLGPVAMAAMIAVAGTALTYAASELIEGVTSIYYADSGGGVNPVKSLLKEVLGDEMGEKVYHAVGIASNIALSFFAPVSTALGASYQAGHGLRTIAQTALLATKEIVIHAAKLAITMAVSTLVNNVVTKLALDLGMSDLGAKLVGFGSALIAGILTYQGLSKMQRALSAKTSKVMESPSTEEIEMAKIQVNSKGDLNYTDNVKSLYKSRNFYSKSALVRDNVNNMTVELNLENPVQIQYLSSSYDYLGPSMLLGARNNGRVYTPGGTYDPATNKIYLFAEKIENSGLDALWTVAHLLRHAYQFEHAEFNSPVMKGLREGSYEEYSQYDENNLNPAEVDACAFADYVVERANKAYDAWVEDPDIEKLVNDVPFEDPITFYEVAA